MGNCIPYWDSGFRCKRDTAATLHMHSGNLRPWTHRLSVLGQPGLAGGHRFGGPTTWLRLCPLAFSHPFWDVLEWLDPFEHNFASCLWPFEFTLVKFWRYERFLNFEATLVHMHIHLHFFVAEESFLLSVKCHPGGYEQSTFTVEGEVSIYLLMNAILFSNLNFFCSPRVRRTPPARTATFVA